ncbi:MAG: rubrerythrin family protein [Desulfovibrionaceae bacterium]|nr:rubrerythrin family protein [Desulfovibrionaceae bacterium]
MATLNGTKTEKNLMEAFVVESQARNKYTYFASKAKDEGYEQVASIFEETANNEKVHAMIWLKRLHGRNAPTTIDNLKAAATGENGEWDDMYKRMAAEAREEGFKDIARLFEGVANIEKAHEERFYKLLKNFESDAVFRKKEKSDWICRNCGQIVNSERVPKKCPICAHSRAYFELRALNY